MIETEDYYTIVACDGVTTSFAFTFPVPSTTDIALYYTDLDGVTHTITSNYSINLNDVETDGLWSIGGMVEYPLVGSPMASGTTLKIARSVDYTQSKKIRNQGAAYAEVMERGLDLLEMQIQQIGSSTLTVSDVETYLNAAEAAAASAEASAEAAASSASTASGLPTASAEGTSDAITATFSPPITLADKVTVSIVASTANTTTTPTFNPNTLGAHVITREGGNALNVGDIAGAGSVYILQYNLSNTRWELLNPSVASSSVTSDYATSAGTASTATLAGSATNASYSTTQNPSDSSTKIATTQFVKSVVSSGGSFQVFTSSGTFTVPTGVTKVYVSGSGGGGGGGGGAGHTAGYVGGGGGGGGGAFTTLRKIVTVTPGESIAVTIGIGGTGGTAGTTSTNGGTGGTGGTSTLGSYASFVGGSGGSGGRWGSNSTSGAGGVGGTTTGAGSTSGSTGGTYNGTSGSSYGGAGGYTILGGNGGAKTTTTTSNAGSGAGGGGSGGLGRGSGLSGVAGAAGAAGVIIVEW